MKIHLTKLASQVSRFLRTQETEAERSTKFSGKSLFAVTLLVGALPMRSAHAQQFELNMGSRTDTYTIAKCTIARETNSDFHDREIHRAKIGDVVCAMVPTREDASVPLAFQCGCVGGKLCFATENTADKQPIPDIFLMFNREYGPENKSAIANGLRMIDAEKKRCSPAAAK